MRSSEPTFRRFPLSIIAHRINHTVNSVANTTARTTRNRITPSEGHLRGTWIVGHVDSGTRVMAGCDGRGDEGCQCVCVCACVCVSWHEGKAGEIIDGAFIHSFTTHPHPPRTAKGHSRETLGTHIQPSIRRLSPPTRSTSTNVLDTVGVPVIRLRQPFHATEAQDASVPGRTPLDEINGGQVVRRDVVHDPSRRVGRKRDFESATAAIPGGIRTVGVVFGGSEAGGFAGAGAEANGGKAVHHGGGGTLFDMKKAEDGRR